MAIFKIFVFFTLSLDLSLSLSLENNVCPTTEDYFDNIKENPNCWFDSDVNATPEQIARNHGFLLERHTIQTEDKYILTTFRLKSQNGAYGQEVIFLQHGLGTDAKCFMGNGNKSVVFFLFEQGYDVWIGNYRGSEFSRHKFLSRDNPKFWNFCLHEHGMYDLAANFKYIASNTKKQIIYIGHSMGGTGFCIYGSIRTEEAKKYIKHAILLAPAVVLKTLKGVANRRNVILLSNMAKFVNSAIPLSVLLGTNSFQKQAFDRFCFSSLENGYVCNSVFEEFFGKGEGPVIPPEKIPFMLGDFKNMGFLEVLHFSQLIKQEDFKMFDYGPTENLLRYNSSSSPSYNISRITIPITWIYGEYDHLATKSDIVYAFNKFHKQNWNIYGMPYGHVLFLVDPNADKIGYPILLKGINKYIK